MPSVSSRSLWPRLPVAAPLLGRESSSLLSPLCGPQSRSILQGRTIRSPVFRHLQAAFHTLFEFDTRRSKRKRHKLVVEALNADPATAQIIYYGPHRGRVLVIIPVLHQCVHEENLFGQPFLAGKQLFAVGRDDPAVDHEVVSKFISKAIASGNLLRLLRSRQPCPPLCCTSAAHRPTPRFQLAGTQLAIIPFAKPLCGP